MKQAKRMAVYYNFCEQVLILNYIFSQFKPINILKKSYLFNYCLKSYVFNKYFKKSYSFKILFV